MTKEPVVTLEIEMTPEQYVALKRNADWDGKSVGQWMLDEVTGNGRKGC